MIRAIGALTLLLLSGAEGVPGQNHTESRTVAEAMATAAEQGGAPAAIEVYREFEQRADDDLDLSSSPIMEHAAGLFSTEQRPTAIAMMEACKEIFPQEVAVHLVLGQFYWYTGDRTLCIESFQTALRLDPVNKMASRFWDLLFFVPDEFAVPEQLRTPDFLLRPLRVTDTELDYQAVMGSRDHIRGVFGPDDDWPRDDLTLEDDRRALTGHEKEHHQRAAFTYTVMNLDETKCLGAVYVLPCHADEYDAQVYLWVTEPAAKEGLDEKLYTAVRQWIDEKWPFKSVAYPGRSIDWSTWAKLDE